MQLKPPANENYAAVVVKIKDCLELENCANVKAALIFGSRVIVSKDVQPGAVGLFFPVETALSPEFLAANNLYRKPEWGNADATKKGFFEQHGRVKAVKFRGHKSEGFWIPLESLGYLGVPLEEFTPGVTFDQIGDHLICKKYVPRTNRGLGGSGRQGKRGPRNEDRLVPGQFRFHYDTANLRRNAHKILPEHWISISDKWHGTSAVFANLLVKRQLRWYEKVLRWLGVAVKEHDYGITWSSRRVIKGVAGETRANPQHYYSEDIWGVVAREMADRLPKGYTVYAEIVGYTTDGKEIQKGYAYGCQPGEHRTLVYRATCTNADGQVLELSWLQLKEFCQKYGFEMVPELWYGKARHFYLAETALDIWQQGFLERVEGNYVTERMCPYNQGLVPAEGVVVRIEGLEQCQAFKLKAFEFLAWESKQLDAGVIDIETQETEDAKDALHDEGLAS